MPAYQWHTISTFNALNDETYPFVICILTADYGYDSAVRMHSYISRAHRRERSYTVDLIVEADISSEWGNLTDTKGGFSRRIIAVLTKNGKQSFRKDLILDAGNIPESKLIPIRFTIPDTDYDISIWCDLVNQDDETPLGYNTDNLSEIRMLHHHGIETSERDCLSFHSKLKTHTVGGESDNTEKMTARLSHPAGRFRIVAADYDSFIESHAEEIRKGGNYKIIIAIDSSIPEFYDMLAGNPMQPTDNISFSKTLT